jgi:trans-aconitate methyltransferase
VEEPYRKDLSHLTWDEVFARQVRRAALVEDWMDALRLQPGARVLDIGAGPGYVSLVLADRVGPEGLVYAVDRSADALAVVAEFHPEGPCEVGPPQAERVPPEQVRAWCEDAGFEVLTYRRQTPEHYMWIVQRCP